MDAHCLKGARGLSEYHSVGLVLALWAHHCCGQYIAWDKGVWGGLRDLVQVLPPTVASL